MKGENQLGGGQAARCAGTLSPGASAALVGAVAFAISANTIANGYISDDFLNVLQNPWVLDPSRTLEAFSRDFASFSGRFQSGLYRPLPFVFHAAWVQTFGVQAWALHLLNVILHSGTAILVYVLLRRWACAGVAPVDAGESGRQQSDFDEGALLGALLFAVTPIHVENVAWISDITDLGCAFFMVCAFLMATDARGFAWSRALGAAAASLMASLFKEPGVLVLPLVGIGLFARGDLRDPRLRRQAVLPTAFLAAAIVTYAILRFRALGGAAPGARRVLAEPLVMVGTAVALFGSYLTKLVVPIDLRPMYDFALVRGVDDPRLWLGAAWLAAGSLLIWRGRRLPGVVLGAAWLVLTLAPALYLPGVGRGLFSERYLYIPSIVGALLVAVGWNRWAKQVPG